MHVIPSVNGNWQVVDLNRRVSTFPNRTSAVQQAEAVAQQHPPSQVVLFDEKGRLVPVAHFGLPKYGGSGQDNTLIEAAVKALVIDGLITVGAVVLNDVINAISRELRQDIRPRAKRKRKSSR